MSGPYQGRDLSNCGVGRLRVAINCGVLSDRRDRADRLKQLSKEKWLETGKGKETGLQKQHTS